MQRPQAGVFAFGSRAQNHLEFDLRSDADLGELRSAVRRLGETAVSGACNLVVGFGSELWRQLAGDAVPSDSGPFVELTGSGGHTAPATQHDMWVWVHGSGPDDVLDCVRAVLTATRSVLTLEADVSCFVYHDSRDLTGFIDGTANPDPAAAAGVALVPDGLAGAGGTHVLVQRWVHDLDEFDALDVAEQERVIGRTKLDSMALDRAVRPDDSHISRAEVHDEAGAEREVFRRSTPYASATEQGLLFLAFSAERDRFDQMLAQMYDTAGSGLVDRLLGFTRAVSGAYYFAPSAEDLAAL